MFSCSVSSSSCALGGPSACFSISLSASSRSRFLSLLPPPLPSPSPLTAPTASTATTSNTEYFMVVRNECPFLPFHTPYIQLWGTCDITMRWRREWCRYLEKHLAWKQSYPITSCPAFIAPYDTGWLGFIYQHFAWWPQKIFMVGLVILVWKYILYSGGQLKGHECSYCILNIPDKWHFVCAKFEINSSLSKYVGSCLSALHNIKLCKFVNTFMKTKDEDQVVAVSITSMYTVLWVISD